MNSITLFMQNVTDKYRNVSKKKKKKKLRIVLDLRITSYAGNYGVLMV